MSGPKHLWAGDWERESQDVRRDERLAEPLAPVEPLEPRGDETPQRPGRRTLYTGLAVAAVLALIAGGALGLSSQGGSSPAHKHRASATPAATVPFSLPPPQQTIPQVTPPQTIPQPAAPSANSGNPPSSPAPGPVVYWLGMQIQTTWPGNVVIDTVRLGSEADRAALEPGEQLLAVDGHQLQSATEIASMIRGLPAGARITVEVGYGSANPQTVALTLGAPPSEHP